MFVLEFPQCAIIHSLYHLVCSITDLESKGEKEQKNYQRLKSMSFCPTSAVNTKCTVENTVVSADSRSPGLGKVDSFSGTQGNTHFLPALKRLENVLKSSMYCICFVCVGKCFCVAPAFLDILYS